MALTLRRSKDEANNRERLVGPLFLLIMLSAFSYFLSVGALIPTLPLFVEGPLHSGSVAVGLAMGAFSLAAVCFRPLVGHIGDRRGRRILMVAGGLFVGSSVLAYMLADELIPLLALRFTSGLGEAAFYVGAASVITDLAPSSRRGEALSYFSLALFGGLALGPVVGETALEHSGFDAAWMVAGVTALMAGLLGLFVKETRPQASAPVEHRALRNRIVHPAGLVPGIVLASGIWGLAGFTSFVPLYARDIGLSGSRLVFGLYSAVVLCVRFFGARIPDRLGARRAGRISLSTSATGFTLIAMWPEPIGLYLGAMIFGLGQSLMFPALMAMAIDNAPPQERGQVVGTFTAFFDLAFGLGAVTLGGVVALLGYRGLFLTSAAMAIGGMIVLLYRIAPIRMDRAP